MTNKEEFLELVSGTDTKVLEQIKWRVENRAWLNRSKAVAIRILSTLKQKKISQIELAKLLKVTPQQINKWLRGNENFTFETISKLESVLNIDLMYIVSKSSSDTSKVQTLEYKLAPTTSYTELSGTDNKIIQLFPNKTTYPSKYTG